MSIEKKQLIERQIENHLKAFSQGSLTENSLRLFEALGYNTSRQASLSKPTYAAFREEYAETISRLNEKKALVKEWKSVDLLFQLSEKELSKQISMFDTKRVDRTIIETYLFFAIELTGAAYSRTALSQITREINKLFPMPVMVLFKTGGLLTLSIINRRLHKRDESKDVLEKVTLIKDISIDDPHRAHIEILFDLSFNTLLEQYKFTNFVELHEAWRKTLDIKELNKRFYKQLSDWYFWAMKNVSFPDDAQKDTDIRNSIGLIRLITRVIFVWFIKEKELVPEKIFQEAEIKGLLKEFKKTKASNSYYTAILQNLFFGTLNQKMGERGFAKEGSFNDHKKEYGIKNLFRYADLFAISEKEVLLLFKGVPFLNGGLFDCLDKENDEKKVIYIDGFSRNPNKQADIPDYLFYTGKDKYYINPNEIYGTKNKKNEEVTGLIDILSAYKFTVVENTPIEEEVALDPELLGKVFENLLASYNPETQTTARKQTGSFYTPREIVNYMVDESLKAYFKQALADRLKTKEEDVNTGLEILFSYTEREHGFSEAERKALIEAIDTCKILDPACGSGAFPMGILHKLVHILHKLDPENEQWKYRQIKKAQEIDDVDIREQAIEDIESAFEHNELDYGRKLFLIENCIYGVDIQPIAVQIAKLRFFISLVVDQKRQEGKENLGIRSLPNLETKFVAANTLIGLEKPEIQGNLFENKEITAAEDKLKELRHRYFSAKTRKEKRSCQDEDKALRQKIAKLLEQDGWKPATAKQIVAFDPYDQNASSPFFDPEWMFGMKTMGAGAGVFDVVIGNPPYSSKQSKDMKALRATYSWVEYKCDPYAFFIELSYKLLISHGAVALIVPLTWMTNFYYEKLRKQIIDSSSLRKVIMLEGLAFQSANVDTSLIFLKKSKSNTDRDGFEWAVSVPELIDLKFSRRLYQNIRNEIRYDIAPSFDSIWEKLKKKIEADSHKLSSLAKISLGLILSGNDRFIVSKKDTSHPDAIVFGNDISLFGSIQPTRFFNFTKAVIVGGTKNPIIQQTKNKVLIQSIRNLSLDRRIVATLDSNGYYFVGTVNSVIPTVTGWNIYYLLGLINSKLCNTYFRKRFTTISLKAATLGELPIKRPSQVIEETAIVNIVNYLLALNHFAISNLNTMSTKLTLLHNFFEPILNGLVYGLYFPSELKTASCEVLKHLTDLPTLQDDWSDEKKLKTIEKVYKELSDPAHPVSIAIEKMKTIPEVRIIEGLDK